jgi:hypothetical protein
LISGREAAGGVLTAKQAPRRPGTAPALGLRAGNVRPLFPSQTIRENRKARRTMPLNLRSLPFAALLIAGAAGLIYVGADGSRRDSDSNSPSIAQCLLDKKPPTDEEMERRRQILLQRFAVKDRAVQKLLGGQLTLLQAAAQFRDVEAAQPITWGPDIAATGPAEGERLCRMVIAMARGWMEEHVPAAAADMTARLEAELEQHRGPNGTVRLPD